MAQPEGSFERNPFGPLLGHVRCTAKPQRSFRSRPGRARQFVQPAFYKMQLFGRRLFPAPRNHKQALSVRRHIKYAVRKKADVGWCEWADRMRGRRDKARLGGDGRAENPIPVSVKEFTAASRPNRPEPCCCGNLPFATHTWERLDVHFVVSGFAGRISKPAAIGGKQAAKRIELRGYEGPWRAVSFERENVDVPSTVWTGKRIGEDFAVRRERDWELLKVLCAD